MWELGGNTSHTVLLRGQHPQPPAGTCTHIPEMFLQLPPLYLCAAFNIRPGCVEPVCCHISSDFPFFFSDYHFLAYGVTDFHRSHRGGITTINKSGLGHMEGHRVLFVVQPPALSPIHHCAPFLTPAPLFGSNSAYTIHELKLVRSLGVWSDCLLDTILINRK